MTNSSTHVYLIALSVCNIFLLVGIGFNYSIKSIGKWILVIRIYPKYFNNKISGRLVHVTLDLV